MRFKQYINEMAMPRELDLKKTYYHGTSKDKFGKSILKKGINPPNLTVKKKGLLTPVEGKVYITPNLKYALIYALGANMIGSDSLPNFITKKGSQNMYIFVIDGKQLKDIQPDEDSVGEMIYNKKPMWLYNMADDILAASTMRRIMDGEYSYWAKGGKVLLKKMTDQQKLELIDAGAHIAHTGTLKPKEAWILPKTDNHLLEKDGSNFFKLAKRIK
jgi:hypothetical protein